MLNYMTSVDGRICVERFAKTYRKIDFHIHSCFSDTKSGDKDKVKENTISNLPVLVSKLDENKVNMAAITDHNIFNFDMYDNFNSLVKKAKHLEKVLPGIELDVEMNDVTLHIVLIFDDSNVIKVKGIEDLVKKAYKGKESIKDLEFVKLVSDIGLDVVVVVHQKKYLGNNKDDNSHSLSTTGENYTLELIRIDYFDALEFRNYNVEFMNRGFVHEKKLECNFISGSDNHIWSCYPFEDENDESDMVYSYLKVIPTFRGIAIAITGENRIEVSEKLIKKPTIENIEFEDGEKIELSSGINAIIGDNAIGKSVILESIFNSNNLQSYHKKYIEKNGWKISPYSKKDYHYDSQGDIREYFQKSNNKLEAHHTIRKYLKNTFDKNSLESMVTGYVDGFLKLVEFNTDIEAKRMLLNTSLRIPKYDEYDYLPKFIGILMPENTTNITTIISGLEKTLESIKFFKELLNSEEIVEVDKFIKYLGELKDQYTNWKEEIIFRNKILNLMISVSEIEKEEMRAYKSVVKQEVDDYRDNYTKIIVDFILVLNTFSKETPFKFSEIKDHVFNPVDNEIGKFKISSQPKKMDYKSDYITQKLLVPLNYIKDTEKAKKLNVKNFTALLGSGFEKEEKKDYKSYYKDLILKNFSKDFIIETKLDYTSELFGSKATSPGINALKYLDIISTDGKLKIVAFDQPEDDVSPTKIGKELSDIIRKMSRNSQVIFVTHNPQLVINLDVDNVVCLTNEDEKINIEYGGLEYENETMSIMGLVADNLDGGAEVIRKRWKRYDKFQTD